MEMARAPRRTLSMNLTALVDIIFMLVIFFMLTTSFTASESMELSLPDRHAKGIAAFDVTQIRIMATGHVTVNDAYVDANGLSEALVTTLGNDPDARIAIFTTPGVSVQQLVSVMDMVYLSGGRNVQVEKAL